MRHDMHLFGHTADGTKCIADTSVYIQEGDAFDKKTAEAAKYAVWFEDKPGFPMVADDTQVSLDHYTEFNKPEPRSPFGLQGMVPIRNNGSLSEIFEQFLGGKGPG